jgi:hypothetical protein
MSIDPQEFGKLQAEVAALRRDHEAHTTAVHASQQEARADRQAIKADLAATAAAVCDIRLQLAEMTGALKGVRWAFGLVAAIGGIIGSLAAKLMPGFIR